MKKSPVASSHRPSAPHFTSPLIPAGWIAALGLAAAAPGQAAAVTLSAGDSAGTTSFNVAGHWSNSAAPAAGNAYFTAAFLLRTPADNGQTYTFGGDSLSIDAGGRLLGKTTGTQTVDFSHSGGLILNGAPWMWRTGARTTMP